MARFMSHSLLQLVAVFYRGMRLMMPFGMAGICSFVYFDTENRIVVRDINGLGLRDF